MSCLYLARLTYFASDLPLQTLKNKMWTRRQCTTAIMQPSYPQARASREQLAKQNGVGCSKAEPRIEQDGRRKRESE